MTVKTRAQLQTQNDTDLDTNGVNSITGAKLNSFLDNLIDSVLLAENIGVSIQGFSATLALVAALTPAADKLPYFTGGSGASLTTLSSYGRSLIDDADASAARTTLGLGTAATSASTAFQSADAELTAIAGLTSAADSVPYFTGSGTAALATFTAFGRSLVDDADASTARTTLGLGTAATSASTAFQAADAELAAIAGLTSAADRVPYFTGLGTAALATFTTFGRSLVDDADASTARTTLGLGTAATSATGDFQAADAELAAIAGLTSAVDRLPYFTGSGTASLATFTTFGRSLVDDADAAAAQTTLGLVIGTNVQAYSAGLASLSTQAAAAVADRSIYFTAANTAALYTITAAARTILDDTTVGAIATTLGLGTGSSPSFSGVTVNSLTVNGQHNIFGPVTYYGSMVGYPFTMTDGTPIHSAFSLDDADVGNMMFETSGGGTATDLVVGPDGLQARSRDAFLVETVTTLYLNPWGGAVNFGAPAIGTVGLAYGTTGNLVLYTTVAGSHQIISSLVGSATVAPTLALRRASDPAAGNALGALYWQSNDSGSANSTYLRIHGTVLDPTATSEDADMRLSCVTAGALTTALTLTGTTAVVPGSFDAASYKVGGVAVDLTATPLAPQISRVLSGIVTGSNVATAQSPFSGLSAINLEVGLYKFKMNLYITRAAGTTAHTISTLFAGTSTRTMTYTFLGVTAGSTAGAVPSLMGRAAGSGAVVVTASSALAAEEVEIQLEGMIRVTAAGTLIPQVQYSVAPGGAPSWSTNSHIHLEKLSATSTIQSIN